MKLKLLFTAEISEDVGDIPEEKVFTEEQILTVLENGLREMVGESSEVIIHNYKMTKVH